MNKQVITLFFLLLNVFSIKAQKISRTKQNSKTQQIKESKSGQIIYTKEDFNQTFSYGEQILKKNKTSGIPLTLYTKEEIQILKRAIDLYVETSSNEDANSIYRSRKMFEFYKNEKEQQWKNEGYPPVIDWKEIQSYYGITIGNLSKAESEQLLDLKSYLEKIKISTASFLAIYPQESDLSSTKEQVESILVKINKEIKGMLSSNGTNSFHLAHIGKILFSSHPVNIGSENTSSYHEVIPLDNQIEGKNNSIYLMFYLLQTPREQKINTIGYRFYMDGNECVMSHGNLSLPQTDFYDKTYIYRNLILNIGSYNSSDFKHTDHFYKDLVTCLSSYEGEHELKVVVNFGSKLYESKVKLNIKPSFKEIARSIVNKVEEGSLANVKFANEEPKSKKYIPYIQKELEIKGYKLLKVVPTTYWEQANVKEDGIVTTIDENGNKSTVVEKVTIDSYKVLLFEYSTMENDGSFAIRKGVLKGNDKKYFIDFTNPLNEGPWEILEKNAR